MRPDKCLIYLTALCNKVTRSSLRFYCMYIFICMYMYGWMCMRLRVPLDNLLFVLIVTIADAITQRVWYTAVRVGLREWVGPTWLVCGQRVMLQWVPLRGAQFYLLNPIASCLPSLVGLFLVIARTAQASCDPGHIRPAANTRRHFQELEMGAILIVWYT